MFTRERLTRWTKGLRENPDEQYGGRLANDDYTKFCCLGKLCEVEAFERKPLSKGRSGYRSQTVEFATASLPILLAEEFGDPFGNFVALNMPQLHHNGSYHVSASSANDSSVPWSVIADHFDKYYPCSDE